MYSFWYEGTIWSDMEKLYQITLGRENKARVLHKILTLTAKMIKQQIM